MANRTLTGRTVLITGGASGIGAACARRLAADGARVLIADVDGGAAAKLAAELGQHAVRADVARAGDIEAMLDAAWQRWGRLDVLFNNAGVFYPQTALECSEKEWDEQIDVNLKGTFLMSKFALPSMIAQGHGVIINNSSGWGIVGGDHAVAYCASKGGIVLMTKAMAIDHGRQGIRVNCICPGDVETPMLPADAKMRGLSWASYLEDCNKRPMGRIGTPEEIAKAVLFLASDDSSFMTGAALVVDGGGTAD